MHRISQQIGKIEEKIRVGMITVEMEKELM
jgi:hypothetical protein